MHSKPILVFGGGNAETLLIAEGPVKIGQKNGVRIAATFGGSGVNCAVRLLAMNAPAIPLLAIGGDSIGHEVRAFIEKVAAAADAGDLVRAYLRSPHFFTPGLSTAQSAILVHAGTRTIFKSTYPDEGAFYSSLAERIANANGHLGKKPAAILIGHLPSPQAGNGGKSDPTTAVVERFHGRCPILINFGQEQLSKGYGHWANLLEKVDYVQMHINEARSFFCRSIPSTRLPALAEFLSTLPATFCITLDHFGAICFRGRKSPGSEFIFVPEYINDESLVVDPTGAGDAFIAGTAFHLWQAGYLARPGKSKWDVGELAAALDEGRKWAAFACTKLGGASEPPDAATLRQFVNQRQFDTAQPLTLYDRAASGQFLRIIDKAFQQPELHSRQ
jgi:sugar/nucleoside kinase (ribokinase family)